MFNLSSYNNQTAIITSDRDVTYKSLNDYCLQFQKHLSSNRLVFLLVHNNLESLVGYIACLNNNNPVLPLNSDVDIELLNNLTEIYQPYYIWKPSNQVLFHEEIIFSFENYALVKTGFHYNILPDNLALLLSTSGSTGSPKLVRLSKFNISSNAHSIIKYLGITKNERPITSLPLYYSFGLSVINSHLLVGATILLTDYSYIQKEFWDFAKENNFTSFSGVPYTFEILKKIKFWSMNLPSLKTITQAGGKLNNDLLKYFIENSEKHGIRFFVMYGQTEATARMSYLSPEVALLKLGSIGKAIPGGNLKIIDEGNRLTSPLEIGELVYEGPNVGLGYAESLKDLYKEDDNHGILYTGDLGYMDSEGFIYITGRKKRFLKLFGNRISLDYVEQILKSYLKEAVCSGNDKKLVIFTTDKDYDLNEIIDALSSKFKLLRTVFEIRTISEIPRSETGKIQYSKLDI